MRIVVAAAVLLFGVVIAARALSGHHQPDAASVPAVAATPSPAAPIPATGAATATAPTPAPAQPASPPAACDAAEPTCRGRGRRRGRAGALGRAAAKPTAAGAAGADGARAVAAAEEAPPNEDEGAPAGARGAARLEGEAGAGAGGDQERSRGLARSTGHHQFGTTPLTLRLRPGNSYDLTFTRSGYAAVTRHYKLEAHGPQMLRVSLKKLPEAHKATAPTPAASKPAAPPPATAKKNNFFSR